MNTRFRSMSFVAVATLSLGVFAAGCATADPAEEAVPVDSTEDALVGNASATLHRPQINSEEYNSIYAAANAETNVRTDNKKYYVRLETPQFKSGLTKLRSMQGWAYVEALNHIYSKNDGSSVFGDSDVAMLLRYNKGSDTWRVIEFIGTNGEVDWKKKWESDFPAMPKQVIP